MWSLLEILVKKCRTKSFQQLLMLLSDIKISHLCFDGQDRVVSRYRNMSYNMSFKYLHYNSLHSDETVYLYIFLVPINYIGLFGKNYSLTSI